MKQYLTIKEDYSAEQIIKKSSFICSLKRISTEEEAKTFIAEISTDNKKANHNCYAYMLGDQDQIQRESDDGEPSGTAGVPILQALQHLEVHDVIAVVTRYFGGIKLGTGGLIRAYNGSTATAIHEVGRIQRILQSSLIIEIAYSDHDTLNYYLNQNAINIDTEDYGVAITTTIFVDESEKAAVIQDITDLLKGKVKIGEGEPRFNEIPFHEK